MVLALDVGNTNIKIGLFDNDEMIHSWRMATDLVRTADEYGIALMQLLSSGGVTPSQIEGTIVSSVIPQLNYTIEHMLDYYLHMKPIMVGPGIKTGLNIQYENPKEVGSDRIVNSVCAFNKYVGPVIVVDFGTATTFNAISKDGRFLGGCICPGVKTSVEALVNATAKLPTIELVKPSKVICKNTITNMQAGVTFGVVGQVRYILETMKKEMGEKNIKVVHVPGTFELTYASNKLQLTGEYSAIIAIGCVIQGDTPHFDYICQGVSYGISQINASFMDNAGIISPRKGPVIFSVLTTLNKQQALERAGGSLGNKGVEGAITAIKMANLKI